MPRAALTESAIDGTWQLQMTTNWNSCILPEVSNYIGNSGIQTTTQIVSIATSNTDQVTITVDNNPLTGTLKDNVVSLTWDYSEPDIVGHYEENLIFNNGTLIGVGQQNWTVEDFNCIVLTNTSGTQLSSTVTDTMPSLQPAKQIASGSFAEPNDSPAEATPILPNDKPLYQLLDAAGDEDWYEFYAQAGKRYTIDIPAASVGQLIDPVLTLYDAASNVLVPPEPGQARQIVWSAPQNALFRVQVSNQAISGKKNATGDAGDYTYQIRVFLTDAPQQGIIKGKVLENCSQQGINEAEVSAWLAGGLTDSTLTYKTGEFGLPLNPDNYDLKSLAANYQEASKPVSVIQEDVTFAQILLTPTASCGDVNRPVVDPVVQAQEAPAVYDEQQGILIVRDLVIDNKAYYAELENLGDYRFKLYRFLPLPGVIHSDVPEYSYNTLTAKLPRVFALNKTWKVQMKYAGDLVFTIDTVEPY